MANIRCKSCGRIYDYRKQETCPKCGAYNRPPHRERVDPDGTVHEIDTPTGAVPAHGGAKVCYEEKTCYEEQTRTSHRGAGVQRLTEQFRSMEKAKRGAVIGVAVTVLILLIPVLRACMRPSYVIDYDITEPVAPAEEVARDYGFYEPMLSFEVLGKTGLLTEIFMTPEDISLTVEGLAADAPLPQLRAYDADDSYVESAPMTIEEWGDCTVCYIYDRMVYDDWDDIVGWALRFETPDGVTEVELTDYLDF